MQKINRSTMLLWAIFIIICSISTLLSHKTVTTAYLEGAMNWLHSQNLYTGSSFSGHGFVYFPQAAILYIPFTLIPFWLAEILWRVLSIGTLAYGVYRFSLLDNLSKMQWAFPIISLVVMAIGFSSGRNGQASILITALSLLSIVEINAERWIRAAMLLTLGLAIKPFILVFLLLVWVLYRPLRWPLIIGIFITVLSPFLFQQPSYVIEQYQWCITMFQKIHELGVTQLGHWAHLFSMLYQLNIADISPGFQTAIRLVMAIVTLLSCYCVQKNFSKSRAIILIYALGTIYLMLFSSRTENSTYILLAPVIGFFIVDAIQKKQTLQVGILITITFGLIGHHLITTALTPQMSSWCNPLMTCFVLLYVLSTSAGMASASLINSRSSKS